MLLMWIRWTGSVALSLALMLSSMVGLAEHDHATAIERVGSDCAVDHEREGGFRPATPDPVLAASGQQHHHRCHACIHGAKRVVVASASATLGPCPGVAGALETRSLLWASASWTGCTPRGPPAV